jgi:hypothetical protein
MSLSADEAWTRKQCRNDVMLRDDVMLRGGIISMSHKVTVIVFLSGRKAI